MSKDDTAFILRIELGNDAMKTKRDIAKALREVAAKVAAGKTDGYIMDANGNKVGEYTAR